MLLLTVAEAADLGASAHQSGAAIYLDRLIYIDKKFDYPYYSSYSFSPAVSMDGMICWSRAWRRNVMKWLASEYVPASYQTSFHRTGRQRADARGQHDYCY